MSEYGFIDGVDFVNLPAEKYWSFPKNYKGDYKAETEYMIKSGMYLGAEKKDGHYARFIKDMDGNMKLQGRTESVNGGYLNKIEWIPQCQEFFDSLPNGTVLLGELYFPNQAGSRKVTTILGCLKDKALKRQEVGEKLHYYIFDVWAYDGKSYLDKSMKDRVAWLEDNRHYYYEQACKNLTKEEALIRYGCVDFAVYYTGDQLWEKLNCVLGDGGEGIVITKADSIPAPGKRTARKTLKVKCEIEKTVDAFVTGEYKPATREYKGKEIETWPYWIDLRTGEKFAVNQFDRYIDGGTVEPISKAYYYGWASSIQFGVYNSKGKIVPIAWISNITDALKKDIVEKNDEYKFRVAEITAMQLEHIDGHYSLRHSKIKNWRTDKSAKDCEFSQIGEE